MTISAIPDASFETFALSGGSGATAEAAAGDPGPDWTPPGSPWRFTARGAGSRAGLARDGAALLALNDAPPYGYQVAFLQQYGVCQQTFSLPAEVGEWVEFRAARCLSAGTPGTPELEVWVNGDEIGLFVVDSGAAYGSYSFFASWREGPNTVLFRQRPTSEETLSMVLLDLDGVALPIWLRLVHADGSDAVRLRHHTGAGTIRLVYHG